MWKVVGEEGIVEEWKVGADLSALGIARRFNVCPGDFLSQYLAQGKVDNIRQKVF
jgi:hypothetical protein